MHIFASAVVSLFVSLLFVNPGQDGTPPPVSPPAVPPPAAAQPQQPQASNGQLRLQPHLLVQHLADAQSCPAPEWIVPGTRLSYFSSVSDVEDAAGAVKLVPDPNGNITDSSGNRFSEGNEVTRGVAGAGWDCFDIVAVEPGVVVITMRQYANLNGLQGPCIPTNASSVMIHPSGCDYYLHPKLLAQLQESSNNGISVIKGTINHRGQTYNAVRSTVEIPNSRQSSMFDLASGVQLTHNSSFEYDKGTAYRASGNTYEGQRRTGRSLANNQFISVRKMELPTEQMALPEWVRTMKRAQYQGMTVDSGTPDMGLGSITVNLSIDVTTQYVGKTFAMYKISVARQMQGVAPMEPTSILTATGPGSVDGFWINPNVLKTMQTGQMLDSDPNTGVQCGVEYVGPGENGSPIVVLTWGNDAYRFSAMYDATDGKLLAASRIEKSQSTGGTLTTQYQLVGME